MIKIRPPNVSRTLLRKIAMAVHHGHLKGVFHHDLKPSNILVTRDGEPKVIDFGVSFMVGAGAGSDRRKPLDENVGTPQYMAPEVAAARPYLPDPRTDVYSLGVIAFEAFAGRRPGVVLPAGIVQLLDQPLDTFEIRRRIAGCEREHLRSADRHFGRDLDCVIAMAIRLEMDRRYNDAAELAGDIGRLLDQQPVRARPASPVYGAVMFVRRNRLAVAAAAVVMLAIAGAAVGFGIGDVRAKASLKKEVAALVDKTAALARERAALAEANRERAVIDQQIAAAHFRTAVLADQRGDWSLAVDEYKAAENGGYAQTDADRLALTTGELRAMDRSGNAAGTDAMFARVRRDLPAVAASPQFQVLEGIIYWPTDQPRSLGQLRRALAPENHLAPADRAFAEALTTDDIRAVEPLLRATVQADPFNRDAWALLSLCDLALGEPRKCEQDAGVLQRLYPEDQVGAVLAATGAAFQQHPDDSRKYLASCTKLPPRLRNSLSQTFEFVGKMDSAETVTNSSTGLRLAPLAAAALDAFAQAGNHAFPTPITFSRITASLSLVNLLQLVWSKDPQKIWEFIAVWPNGDGEFALGWIAMGQGNYAAAIPHFQAAATAPGLIDCHRLAAIALIFARDHDRAARHAPPGADETAAMKPAVNRLIELGGVRPDKFAAEGNALHIVIDSRLYPEARRLALQWLSLLPDDPNALYWLAVADAELNDRETAAALLNRAIAKGLAGDLKTAAESKLAELARGSETRPVAAVR